MPEIHHPGDNSIATIPYLHCHSSGSSVPACVCVCSIMSDFATPWSVAHQVPLSMEFSRQEYWSVLPFPPLGDLPDTGIKPASLVSPALAGRFFTTLPPGRPSSVPARHVYAASGFLGGTSHQQPGQWW